MNEQFPQINFGEYVYELPEDRIAKFPLDKRDESKLLLYRNGEISHHHFYNLPGMLPKESFLIFNNTKVFPARLFFYKSSGALIELFLLHPVKPALVLEIMQAKNSCIWDCLIGNKKKWKNETLIQQLLIGENKVELKATLLDQENQRVQLEWNGDLSFAELMQHFGEIPLPPYLKRKATIRDIEQYQTVYSKNEGAVAAPTAGLHFTEDVFADLEKRRIEHDYITLHVSAGTFQPIKVETAAEHQMHAEQMIFTIQNVRNILKHLDHIIAVGTTSLRTLESLYYIGCMVKENEALLSEKEATLFIPQSFPYQNRENEISPEEAMKALLMQMEKYHLEEIVAETAIFIVPSYQFKICKGLVTNFHQPNSTLILLVAAFVGDSHWKPIYQEALDHDYRFLSYGDSSLLIPSHVH